MKHSLAAALCIGLSLPASHSAGAWTSPDNIEVLPLSEGGFEVIGRGGYSPMKYWCGAGDYALTVQRVPPTHRLFLKRGQGPSATRPGRRSMQFSLQAPTGSDSETMLSVSLTRPGENLSVSTAREQCWNQKMFD